MASIADPGVRVRLLEPVEVVVADGPQAVNGVRREAVLATLALHVGRVVSVDRLVDVVWGESPPATAGNTLQRHVSYLRGVLGEPGSIVARRPGYLLRHRAGVHGRPGRRAPSRPGSAYDGSGGAGGSRCAEERYTSEV
ncbi:AfsR/SARP family transcriptional regulator [Micromonospora sp. DT44]|uniref:AfsR/SARP family transcriptional regulator n=1 Tax=Micromonospora sp. DT44 TaxID=3393439 RepID=UPI003CF734E5